jgi:hypothetical protein
MSELSFDELQAEHIEMLPERETLGAIIINQVGGAEADQAFTFAAVNKAVNVQSVDVAVASFNSIHVW